MIDFVNKSVDVLNNGGVILYPTNTVWGLGCLVSNELGYKKIYQIKNRIETNPYILLVSSFEMLTQYVEIEFTDELLALVNDEIPTTVIYPGTKNLPKHALANNGSVAIRITQHPFCINLIDKASEPIVSTSANVSGNSTPSFFKDVEELIKSKVDFIVPAEVGEGKGQASRLFSLGVNNALTRIR